MHFIIFDLDGTLGQTYYSDDNSYLTALSKIIDVDPNYAYWKECPNLTDRAVLNYIFQKKYNRLPTKQEVQHMQALFMDQLRLKHQKEPHFFHPIPGAPELFNHLHNNYDHVKLGVATGGWKSVAQFKLDLLGINHCDYHLIGSDDHDAKCDFVKALIQNVELKEQIKFTAITYVGDSLYDMKAAKQLNIDFLGVDYKKIGHFQQNGHHTVLEHYTDLSEVLKHFRLDAASGSNLSIK